MLRDGNHDKNAVGGMKNDAVVSAYSDCVINRTIVLNKFYLERKGRNEQSYFQRGQM